MCTVFSDIRSCTIAKTDVNEKVLTLKASIQMCFDEVHEALDQRQEQLLQKLDRIANDKKRTLENVANDLSNQYAESKQVQFS